MHEDRRKEIQRRESAVRRAIEDQSLVVVIGAGVSILLQNDFRENPLTWLGLVQNGVEYIWQRGFIDAQKRENYNSLLLSKDLSSILLVAEAISMSLGGANSDLFSRWIRNVFEDRKPSVGPMWDALQAIKHRGIPIATLNYDTLLEDCLGYVEADFTYPHSVAQWNRTRSGILHLHGVWTKPATCVFGIRDYSVASNDPLRTLLQQSIGGFRSLLFVGCGETFDDPNFSTLIEFLRHTVGGSMPSHYSLVLTQEVAFKDADPKWRGFIDPIGYGDKYDCLPEYLTHLRVTAN